MIVNGEPYTLRGVRTVREGVGSTHLPHDLDVNVSKLKMMQANYLSNKYTLEDKILKHFPSEIKRLENSVQGYEKDIQRVSDNTKGTEGAEKAFNGMIVNGNTYTGLQKEESGKALLSACRGVMKGDEGMIGEYRGFPMQLSYDSFFNQFNLQLKGNLSHRVVLGSDVFGNITRIDNALDGMQTRLDDTIGKLEGVYQQLKSAKIEVQKPFDKGKELTEMTKRLSELDQMLNMSESVEPVQTVSELDRAKDYIIEFIESEYDHENETLDDKELSAIDVAYTTTTDDQHEIQARVDLENFKVNTFIDDVLVHQDQYGTLKEMNDYHLQHLDFESLISVSDADVAKVEKLTIDKDTDVDGVIDRFDSDSRDFSDVTQGDFDKREKGNSQVSRPSVLEMLKKNRYVINGATERRSCER